VLGTSLGMGGTSSAGAFDTLERKRLHVKQYIDHVLNTLKAHSDPHSHTLAETGLRRHPSPPEPTPFGEYTFYPTKPDNETASKDELPPRRPSLPHIYNELPVPSHPTNSQRPRSAGQEAEPEPPRAPTTRKLGSK